MKPTDEQVERVMEAITEWVGETDPEHAMCAARAAIAAMPEPCAIPAQGEPVAWDDNKLAAWARNWHWNDCAADQPVDPSIYFRDQRMLRAFLAALPNSPAPLDAPQPSAERLPSSDVAAGAGDPALLKP